MKKLSFPPKYDVDIHNSAFPDSFVYHYFVSLGSSYHLLVLIEFEIWYGCSKPVGEMGRSIRPFLLQNEVMKKFTSSPKNNVDIHNSAFPDPFAHLIVS